ncbi:MAG: PSD1 and planctomycete cytochrome C domain-containing protein [Pirellulales bacterium]
MTGPAWNSARLGPSHAMLLALLLACGPVSAVAWSQTPPNEAATSQAATSQASTTQAAPAAAAASADELNFAFDIRPILADRCFRCHGPDDESVQAGLRLDDRSRATATLDSGERAIVPNDEAASELLQRIATDDADRRMPPPEMGPPLTPAQQELLRRWIQQGAPYSDHWSLIPPVRPQLPQVSSLTGQARNGIDRFILQRLEREHLQAQPEADRYTLARRLYLDLLGVPPTPAEADSFVNDPRPDAYERLVDQLLADPAFGERWARLWLDLARYADSAGYAQDPPRAIWRYRDWVIGALNRNLPYDEFTVEQLAGDLLPNAAPERLIATAFHRNTMTNSEGGTDDEEFRNAAVVDRVNTTMQVWMGLTMECAQCHNHKYDPVTQQEYYRVFAVFNTSQDADRPDESPLLEEFSASQLQRRDELQTLIAAAEAKPESERPAEQLKAWKDELQQIRPITTPVMKELPTEAKRQTHVQIRGNFRKHGEQVEPGVPAKVHASYATAVTDRLGLAQWLTDRQHPLVARVAVNRLWEQIFGRGIVETGEDFGTQGALPSHPRLLDWLACEYIDSGWDTKHMLRLMVTSATYRQSSEATDALNQHDPENILLSRGPRFRLPAEMVRDQALAAAGLLSRKMMGPSVRPPQPKLQMNASFGESVDWDPSPGEDRYRRGIYTLWRRTSPYPSMITFDAPSREFCTIRRIRTNTPLQALVTLNDPVYIEAAQALARRTLAQPGTPAERAAQLHRWVLTRPATETEISELVALFDDSQQHFAAHLEAATALATNPLGPLPADMSAAEAASWTVVANVVLNLDETLSRP